MPMPDAPTTATARPDIRSPRFAHRFNQELLKINVKRMLAFCCAYVVLQGATLIFNAATAPVLFRNVVATRISWVPNDEFLTTLTLLALCAGIVFGILFAVMMFGSIRNPRTQNIIIHTTLIILSLIQLVICSIDLNIGYYLHSFLIYLLMLGVFPVMPRVQSTAYIAAFTLLCWMSFLWAPPENLSFMGAETNSPLVPLAFTGAALDMGAALIIPAVILVSLAVSWLNFGMAKKSILSQLALEEREKELEASIEERTAEYKEQARVAEAANRAKTRFLTRVSHEMRTSMTTISGMAFLAKESADPVSRQESLEAIDQASQKLKDVVNNIIDTTQIEADFSDDDFNQDFALLKADAAAPQQPPKQVDPPDLTNHHILIVEDLETNRLVLREFLKETHAHIDEAENGREAVEMFAASPQNHYSFVFMDLLMPEMSGHDATRAIRKMERGDALTTPIIAVSANAFKEDIEASLAAGMDAHLAKPIDQSTIFRTLIERLP